MMKKSILFLLMIAIGGCTYTSEVSYGTPFNSEQVSGIVKGSTTTIELESIFGQPSIKSVLSENEEKWVYSYTGGSASAQAFTMKTTSDISTHMLDILIRDGKVINFAETKTKNNMNIKSSVN